MGQLASALRETWRAGSGKGIGVPGPMFLGRDDSGSRLPVSRGPQSYLSSSGPVPTPGPQASVPRALATQTRPRPHPKLLTKP